MVSRFRGIAAPAYLLLCLLLGGSGQGVWANMLLQVLGLGLMAWAATSPEEEAMPRGQRQLLWLILIALAIIALQLIPLPASLWQRLGGRQPIVEGFEVLGIALPALSVSVAPYETVSGLLGLIPGLAVLIASLRLGTRPLPLVLAVFAGTFGGILIGALQVSSADPANSPWYFYPQTNYGVATGFFANANHMATLLIITLPFLAAVLASVGSRRRNAQRYSAVLALVAGGAVVVAVGIALNGSLAGYGLAVPVLLASALIVLPSRSRAFGWLAPLAGVLLICAIGWLTTTPLSNSSTLRSNAETSVQSRAEILRTSVKAVRDFMPFGSGMGSFREVYALYEDHDRLDPNTYVNHAHNDYVELALETGVPGLIVLILFLGWWGKAAWKAWRRRDPDPFARAAAVASAAILIHSIVDFPLRTAAIAGCFAMCLGLLIRQRRAAAADTSDLRPTRHVVLD
ncbi:MAG TPA: O-antigen ligase family protein [Sphingomicrobium sp.]